MSWLSRWFGGESQTPEALPAPEPIAKQRLKPATQERTRAITPASVAHQFARGIVGARVEDTKGDLRHGYFNRVHYSLDGVEYRLSVRLYDETTVTVWLTTRCEGAAGAFDLLRLEPDPDAPPPPDHLYLARSACVTGGRARNEAARILALDEEAQRRLFALLEHAELITLADETLSLRFGDLSVFQSLLSARGGRRVAEELGRELGFIAAQLPRDARDVVAMAEARVCSYCGGRFVFSPKSHECPRCGAATAAHWSAAPAPDVENLKQDADWVGDREAEWLDELMVPLRDLALRFAALVQSPRIVEQRECARVYVEYELDGRPYRAKIHEDYVGVRLLTPELKGGFYLSYDAWDLDDGGKRNAEAWTQAERRIFFTKHLRVGSPRTDREVARLATLPAMVRADLLAFCEHHEHGVSLEEGELALGLGPTHRIEDPRAIIDGTRRLTELAAAFPSDYRDEAPPRFVLADCKYCRAAHFREPAQKRCSRCGAED